MSAFARVTITVEFDVGSKYGDDWTIDRIRKDAIDGAKQILRRGLILDGLTAALDDCTPHPARIVGEPKIDAVIVKDQP